MKKKVLISGDIVFDHCIYQGPQNSPGNNGHSGTHDRIAKGRAALVCELLAVINATGENGSEIQFGLNTTENIPGFIRTYSLWKPFPADDQEPKKRVWRTTEFLGYGGEDPDQRGGFFSMSDNASEHHDLIVIDDAALHFRYNKNLWPPAIQPGTGRKKIKKPERVVMWMSNPIAMGDLWYQVSGSLGKETIGIVSADDIRLQNGSISKGCSWERSALDLLNEVDNNPTIRDLKKCAHLIVTFGLDGALWLDNEAHDCRLIFDPASLEGEWEKKMAGKSFGYSACFMAGLVHHILRADNADVHHIGSGIKSGLCAMRRLHHNGHGDTGAVCPGFPMQSVVNEIVTSSTEFRFAEIQIPVPDPRVNENKQPQSGKNEFSKWTIVENLRTCSPDKLPLYGRARIFAKYGLNGLKNIPYARFGKLLVIDRNEIENLNAIKKLVDDYEADKNVSKPLSIAVFGPPGSGKSFGIKQIAKSIFGEKVPILEFNLSQFPEDPKFIIDALHQVRDKVLQGKTPFVFWDEFDCKDLFWLQYLLAPMQDGEFRDGQILHPVGKSIFIFAGGTSYTVENFGPAKTATEEKQIEFKMKKGPDFISRLRGSLNVLGPNRRQQFDENQQTWLDDPNDICFPLRRAILMRGMLKLKDDKITDIDESLLNALLKTKAYKHGARSLETVLNCLKNAPDTVLLKSNLPSAQQLTIHVDPEDFTRRMRENYDFKTKSEELAPLIHQFYLDLSKRNSWPITYGMPYADLPKEIQADNIDAAKRMTAVLSLAGLQIVPKSGDEPSAHEAVIKCIDENLELLAKEEHNLWMKFKLCNGWRLAEKRNDAEKKQHCLVPYNRLNENDKDKDRDSVRNYTEIAKMSNYKIVFEE